MKFKPNILNYKPKNVHTFWSKAQNCLHAYLRMRASPHATSAALPSLGKLRICHYSHRLSLKSQILTLLRPTRNWPSLHNTKFLTDLHQIYKPISVSSSGCLIKASMASSAATTKPFSVLFVCLGNICRSPAAEGVFRDIVKTRGIDSKFNIDSAGTIDYHEVSLCFIVLFWKNIFISVR